MPSPIRKVVPVVVAGLLAACASARPAPAADEPPPPADAAKKAEPEESRSILVDALLYLPNRVVDVLDVVRFGVDVGPGIGVDAQVTDPVSVVAMTRTYVGAGYQTLRHMPVAAGAEAGLGVGPATLDAEAGGWYRSPTDVRVGLHALLVGGHVAVEPVEILDAVLGLVFIDIRDDDF
jgi:hypothetical protein